MNINITLFIQIFNVILMSFLLGKILIGMILKLAQEKKTKLENLLNQINQKQESISNLVAQNADLWERFKKQNGFAVNSNSNKNIALPISMPEEFCEGSEPNKETQLYSRKTKELAQKGAEKIIKQIGKRL